MNEWEAWKKQKEQKAAEERAARLLTREQVKAQPLQGASRQAVRRKITKEELEKVRRLARCSLRSGYAGGDKRFVAGFERANEETEITERQAWFVEVLWYRYRRQLGHNGKKPEGMYG